MVSTTFLLIVAVALTTNAASTPPGPFPVSIMPFRRHINSTSLADIVAKDKARFKAFRDRAHAKFSKNGKVEKRTSISVTNAAVTYTASVGVGSPATQYTLLIDTGSSNTFVGTGRSYVKTITSKSTGNAVSVTYGSGYFSGTEYTDTVELTPALTIKNQSIGVASSFQDFQGVDGILGIGPVDLTEDTVANTTTVPTVTDNLLAQGKIASEVIGIYYAPTSSQSVTNGELTFGGVDTSKITSAITYVPITTTYPSNYYWGIDQNITYGSTLILDTTAGIVDTGTTLILIADDGFKKYKNATGATLDYNSGLYKITAAQYAALQPLNFNIGATTLSLSPNGQILPRALNTYFGGSANGIYLMVSNTGSDSGEGLDFTNGYALLERFYSVFDTTRQRVGFATTAQTTATTN